MNRRKITSTACAVAVLLSTAARCGEGAETAARDAGHERVPRVPVHVGPIGAGDGHVLGDAKLPLSGLPPGVTAASVQVEQDSLLHRILAVLTDEQRKEDVEVACRAKDLYDAGKATSPEEATAKVAAALGLITPVGEAQLTRNLDSDEQSGNPTLEAAAFGLCQWAASQ